jgi:hypothetical protein
MGVGGERRHALLEIEVCFYAHFWPFCGLYTGGVQDADAARLFMVPLSGHL